MRKRTHEQTADKPPLCKGGKERGDCKSWGIEERLELQEGFCNDKQSLSLNHTVQSAPFTQGSLQCGKTACGDAADTHGIKDGGKPLRDHSAHGGLSLHGGKRHAARRRRNAP